MTSYTVLRRMLLCLPVRRVLASSPANRVAVWVDPAIYLTALTTAGTVWSGTEWKDR